MEIDNSIKTNVDDSEENNRDTVSLSNPDENLNSILKPSEKSDKKKRPKEPGIIYLSYIPPLMNVKKIREIFSEYGEIGRVFLQPNKSSKKGKPSKYFTEGWVEFKDHKIAKRVTLFLNGKQIGGKRRCPWYDSLWSIKYLHRFKWTHLSEKLSYERAVHEQKLRNEVAQAKREANFYTQTVERTQRLKRKMAKEDTVVDIPQYNAPVYQKPTDSEMREKSAHKKSVDKTLLKSIFGLPGND